MKNYQTILFAFTLLFAITGIQAQNLYAKCTLHLKTGKTQEVFIEIDFEHSQRTSRE